MFLLLPMNIHVLKHTIHKHVLFYSISKHPTLLLTIFKRPTTIDLTVFTSREIKKKLSEDLKNIQKELQWIPDQIESIRIWLEYNRERAVNIN